MNDRDQLQGALPSLNAFIKSKAGGAIGDLEVERQFESGQSNPTYLMRAGSRRLVLRKQPYGHLQPKAHDVAREYEIIRSLFEKGFPVPRPLLLSSTTDTIGTQFFLMDYVEGVVYSNSALPDNTPWQRTVIYAAMADTLAQLHNIDPAVLEVANIRPRPDFVGRQVAIWRGQYQMHLTEPDARVESVAQWLLDNKPAEGIQTIVHGDYRIENLIMRDSRVAAVLDWELCAIGDPLCDLAYCCIWHHLPHDVLDGLAGLDLSARGIPSESQFIARYAEQRGIDPANFPHHYFLTFAFYRLASILQGVYRRGLEGNAASPYALARGKIAELLLEKAAAFASKG